MNTKAEQTEGDRLKHAAHRYKSKKGNKIEDLSNAAGVTYTTFFTWYSRREFKQGSGIWEKLEPALRKCGIDPNYIKGKGSKVWLKERKSMGDIELLSEILKELRVLNEAQKQTNALLGEILDNAKDG